MDDFTGVPMRQFTVFYAWQSDTPLRFNRHLIRFALETAAKRISTDLALQIAVRIDADTEGVLGQPPVTETILNKIADCDVFAPDFTFVATAENGKRVPNPNVMIEYGYALRAKGYSAMLPVMNAAFGAPENLPFDMGHLRHPIKFHLQPIATTAERRTVRKSLSEEFERILRMMIESRAIDERRAGAALSYFVPELARIVAQQIQILERIVPNFVSTSTGQLPVPGVDWRAFKPSQPTLYPSAAEFRHLAAADATLLVEFYDSLHGITETINSWIGNQSVTDVNSWNVLIQMVQNSLLVGQKAVQRFCPERQYSPIMPSAGTLLQRSERAISGVRQALSAHSSRQKTATL